MDHDCMRDGCKYDGSLFCIYCGLTAEDIADTEDMHGDEDWRYIAACGCEKCAAHAEWCWSYGFAPTEKKD